MWSLADKENVNNLNVDTEKKRSKGVVEYEKHGRIWNQKNHSGSEHKRPWTSCQGGFNLFHRHFGGNERFWK